MHGCLRGKPALLSIPLGLHGLSHFCSGCQFLAVGSGLNERLLVEKRLAVLLEAEALEIAALDVQTRSGMLSKMECGACTLGRQGPVKR